jgi:hypothetical protein
MLKELENSTLCLLPCYERNQYDRGNDTNTGNKQRKPSCWACPTPRGRSSRVDMRRWLIFGIILFFWILECVSLQSHLGTRLL